MAKRGALSKPSMNKPIVIGGFTLTSQGMETRGRPSFMEYEAVGEFIRYAHQRAGWWLADWLRYGDTRDDWRERLSQAIDSTGLSEKTLKNVRAIGAIDASIRRPDTVDFSLHGEVAGMTPADQVQWLDRAESNGWTHRELRLEIRASKRRKIIDGQALLEGMFRVIYADPPWLYGDRPPSGSGAQQHYPGMTIEALCKLPVAAHSLPDAVLFLWTTAPMILENPGPREVIEAWGFKPKTGIVWDKVRHGFGHYVEVRHEHLIIATRGSCVPDRPTPMFPSVQVERRSDVHSEKPASFRTMIERLYDGPYLELFARQPVAGWSCFGNDARLWAEEAQTQYAGV